MYLCNQIHSTSPICYLLNTRRLSCGRQTAAPQVLATMFSAHDAEEVFQMLALEGELSNPLMVVPYDAYGYVFITRKYVRQAFRDLVISGKYCRCSNSHC